MGAVNLRRGVAGKIVVVLAVAGMLAAQGTAVAAAHGAPAGRAGPGIAVPAAVRGLAPVPVPYWWNGMCDVNRTPASSRVASWDGLIACGPGSTGHMEEKPLQDNLEWQCVELSERWLLQEFTLPAQPGNGYQVVTNYWSYIQKQPAGAYPLRLVTPATATAGSLGPGDVISYANVDADNGHTDVVTATSPAPFTGTGTITTLNENTGGFYQLKVSNWKFGINDLSGHYMAATGWLHYTGSTDGVWGTAAEVQGTQALNSFDAQISTVSCASAGNCSAGGHVGTDNGLQPIAVSEVRGNWGVAKEIPGIAALNKGGQSDFGFLTCDTTGDDCNDHPMSCPSPGDCGAGGYYTDKAGHQQAFVVTQSGGTWGTAREVPGVAALNTGGEAAIESVSCPSNGNCAAGGSYTTGKSGLLEVFIVSEVNGIWGTAREVPGTAALNSGGNAIVSSVSCSAPGDCVAGGDYRGKAGEEAFISTENGGTWGKAVEVPGTAALNSGGGALVASVSCASNGNCSAGGDFTNSSGVQPFVISESNGTWAQAREVPSITALNKNGLGFIASVSCSSAGNCSAVGVYADGSKHQQAFVVSQIRGTWDKAEEVPGTAALNSKGNAWAASVSCRSAGNCSAGGSYEDSSKHQQAFVVDEVKGTWLEAQEVPGTAALNSKGSAAVFAVSCGAAGICSAGGTYEVAFAQQAFIVTEG